MRVKKERYRFIMRVLNTLVRWLQPLGITPRVLDAKVIIRKAERKTGLSDLGNNAHEPGMSEALKSINSMPISPFGKLSSTGFAVEALSNRLKLVDYLKHNPKVLETKVNRPLFIIGFPRTGTTLIQNLLALSSDRRALQFWEIMNPIPVSKNRKLDVLKRKRRAAFRLGVANFALPEMKYLHEVKVDSYEECWPMMINQFTAGNWEMMNRFPEFGKWMQQADLRYAYEEYKKYLQILISAEPDKDLVLKCPDHMWYIDKILEVFPDAMFVWTHRDPSKSVASYCSMVSLNWRLLYGEYDPKEVGPYIEERFIQGINRALAIRERVGEDKFLDVNFQTLLEDPIKAINQITSYFNLTPVEEDKMKAYLNSDRSDERGNHTYSAERYGLDVEKIREHYKDYIQRFDIPISEK
ncbi:sulfotransferase [Bacteroidota bacterium]